MSRISPAYIRDRTPLGAGQVSTRALREEFRRNPGAAYFVAMRNTLKARLPPITGYLAALHMTHHEDASDDESRDEVMDAQEVAQLEEVAQKGEERADIERLLELVKKLPLDTKATELITTLKQLAIDGYRQVMVFTQYTDTMDFLRDLLVRERVGKLICLSGRGGEAPEGEGSWRTVSRDEIKRRFREGTAEILLCTDAASEGLNFQFCGAVINYDMPWNPMRVEQRIGRIDRLGQKHDALRVINLHYRGTVEADVYLALRKRIRLFESVVGRLQPILARLPGRISGVVLQGSNQERERARDDTLNAIDAEIERAQSGGFDLDDFVTGEVPEGARPRAPLDLSVLDAIIRRPDLMPEGIEVRPLGHREYGYLAPGMANEVRVTTDPDYYEEHAESVELWSPGSPVFPRPEVPQTTFAAEEVHALLRDRLQPA